MILNVASQCVNLKYFWFIFHFFFFEYHLLLVLLCEAWRWSSMIHFVENLVAKCLPLIVLLVWIHLFEAEFPIGAHPKDLLHRVTFTIRTHAHSFFLGCKRSLPLDLWRFLKQIEFLSGLQLIWTKLLLVIHQLIIIAGRLLVVHLLTIFLLYFPRFLMKLWLSLSLRLLLEERSLSWIH